LDANQKQRTRRSKQIKESIMKRLLATTAVGIFLGLTPVLAQSPRANDAPNAPAMQIPAQPSDPTSAMNVPEQTSEPSATPGRSSEALPQSISPEVSSASPAPAASAQFLNQQKSNDWLASKLIGQAVVNAKNETIGDINDLVTDNGGKVVAVLIGSGGFLGIGEKHIAVRFEDLKLAHDENNRVKVIANLTKETLAAAPDYKTLDEQQVVEGANKSDREDNSMPRTD
jgi:hypothetical protein